MDPNEALKQMRQAISDGRDTEAAAYAEDLDEWLSKGGFLPAQWSGKRSKIPPTGKGSNTGHGIVWERPDGTRNLCGGPMRCRECSRDLASLAA